MKIWAQLACIELPPNVVCVEPDAAKLAKAYSTARDLVEYESPDCLDDDDQISLPDLITWLTDRIELLERQRRDDWNYHAANPPGLTEGTPNADWRNAAIEWRRKYEALKSEYDKVTAPEPSPPEDEPCTCPEYGPTNRHCRVHGNY